MDDDIANILLDVCRSDSDAHTSSTTNPGRTSSVWTEEMNVMLCREVAKVNPFLFKERTKERGYAWEEVAKALRKYGHVTKRSVRDKYRMLKEAIIKDKHAGRDSGTVTSIKLRAAFEEMSEIISDFDFESGGRDPQSGEEGNSPEGVGRRKRTLESVTSTSKRSRSEEDDALPMMRENSESHNNDFMLRFLLRKLEMDREMREREFEQRSMEAEMRRQADERRWAREARAEERLIQDELRRRLREERAEERRKQEEERQREREEIAEERRKQDEIRRQEKEERDELRRIKEDADKEKRMELFQQQLLQQSQIMMMMFKNYMKE